MTNYVTTQEDLDVIKKFEGLATAAYKCPAGVWTIGYGHTRGVSGGDRCTEQEAEAMLREDVALFEEYVNGLDVCRTQGQFAALTDFAFNCGCAKLASSTLLKRIRAGAGDDEICAQFMRWVYAGGTKLAGLQRRREWEARRWRE